MQASSAQPQKVTHSIISDEHTSTTFSASQAAMLVQPILLGFALPQHKCPINAQKPDSPPSQRRPRWHWGKEEITAAQFLQSIALSAQVRHPRQEDHREVRQLARCSQGARSQGYELPISLALSEVEPMTQGSDASDPCNTENPSNPTEPEFCIASWS